MGKLQNIEIGGAPGESIGIRKKSTFRVNPGLAEARHELGVGDRSERLLYALVRSERATKIGVTCSLDHDQGLEKYSTLIELPKNVLR
jgi:hypothetical protein